MLDKIKNRIEKELPKFITDLDKSYSLSKLSPILFQNIKEFVLRKGKRVRPTLFIIGYLGFSKNKPANLYRSALSLEFLHDFMLVHDDIIDKSELRRGKPAMHTMFNKYLKKFKKAKFSGEDLTIVAGDIMYALGLQAFLSINEKKERKELALRKLIDALIYTGSGEFIELLYGAKDINKITQRDIYKIYDLKTAYYTFSFPLTIGASLSGAKESEITTLFQYGAYLGRAFQIKDDIISMFSAQEKIGKSVLADLQEAKKTIIIWYAYNNSKKKDRTKINHILNKKAVTKTDLASMRKIAKTSGALEYAKKEVASLIQEAASMLDRSKISQRSKKLLYSYCQKILNL
ncbi:MAG: polyprenyl synthetase family protein [Candidatus Omnitrophota bacterium]